MFAKPSSTAPSAGPKRGLWRWQNQTRQGLQAHGSRRPPRSSCRRLGYESHEVTLAESTLDAAWVDEAPHKLIGDRAYDSDPLDERLAEQRGIESIAPHKNNRKRAATQDGRPLRRYVRRWKVERLFAWLHNFRRIVVRYEQYLENFQGFVHLGCMMILLRQF